MRLAADGEDIRHSVLYENGPYSILLKLIFAIPKNCLTSNGRRRKNRNIGGTACTIKRAGVVNDSAPESCADCVFGAFFGGSASHQRGFFVPVFFSHAVSLLGGVRLCGCECLWVGFWLCARRGQAPSTRFLRANVLDSWSRI